MDRVQGETASRVPAVIRVLLAEDPLMFRTAVRRLLDLDDDIQVVAAVGRGDELVPVASATRPDVAVVDIEMPEPDGLSAAADLLRSPEAVFGSAPPESDQTRAIRKPPSRAG